MGINILGNSSWTNAIHRLHRLRGLLLSDMFKNLTGRGNCQTVLTDMDTTVREFQRNFARMRRIAGSGNVVRIKARERIYTFRAENPANGFFGACAGLGNADALRPEDTGATVTAWHANR